MSRNIEDKESQVTEVHRQSPPPSADIPASRSVNPRGPGDVIATLTKVSKWYPDPEVAGKRKVALDRIDLEIMREDRVAIVGRSGHGKSTLLNLLALLEDGSAGDYHLLGDDVSADWKVNRGWRLPLASALAKEASRARARSRMGFVFQTPFMLSNFSVKENIALSYWVNHGEQPPEDKLQDLLRDLGLTEHGNKTAEKVSGGQRQRAAIGRALINDPMIVFADEPTGSLDPDTAESVMELLTRACEERGTSLVLVTHSKELAVRYSDRVVGLRDGRKLLDERGVTLKDLTDFLAVKSAPRPQLLGGR